MLNAQLVIGSLGMALMAGCSGRSPDLVPVRDARGRIVAEVTFSQGIKNGSARFLHPGGSVMKQGAYAGDLKQGLWTTFAENGTKTAELNYHMGRLDGVCRWWDANGQLTAQEPYEKGVFHGMLQRWFADGSLRQQTHFEHGLAKGEYIRHVRDGDTLLHGSVIKGYYANGMSNGIWTSYTGDGRLMSEGRFVDAQRVGIWRYWDREGRLVKEVDHENGGVNVVRDLSKEKGGH